MVIVVNNVLYFGVVLLIRINGNYTGCLCIYKHIFQFCYFIYIKLNYLYFGQNYWNHSMVWTTLYNNRLCTNFDIQSMIIKLHALTLWIIYANTLT